MFGLGQRKKPDAFSQQYAVFALKPQKKLILVTLVFSSGLSLAQQAENYTEAYATADSKRNAAYSLAYPKLTSPEQEMLIRAELAWTDFSDKEKALMNALQNENLISREFVDAHSIGVVDARTNHVQAFFVDYNINYPPQYTPQNRDQELNKNYGDCFSRMNSNDQGLLLSSERAWITYRDADIAVVVACDDNKTWVNAAMVDLTWTRAEQLASIVQSLSQAPIANIPPQELPPPPVQNGSPNPEDIKALAEFQNQAKGVLNALLAKKDDSFFKTADTIKNPPELPAEISDQISKLEVQYVALSQKPHSAELLKPALNECAAVVLLASWSRFKQRLKVGNVVDTDLAIQMALSQKPQEITAAYLPLWRIVGSWRDLFIMEEAKYYDHIDKGDSFADLGKTSVAIKEYQAAYDIIPNPSISEKIRKLREQSLGL